MDEKIHSIEKLLFVLLKRHTAFNGQFSIGVHRRFCGREFAPSGDKPPPADAPYAIGLLNVLILRAADFVPDYKVSRLFHKNPASNKQAFNTMEPLKLIGMPLSYTAFMTEYIILSSAVTFKTSTSVFVIFDCIAGQTLKPILIFRRDKEPVKAVSVGIEVFADCFGNALHI